MYHLARPVVMVTVKGADVRVEREEALLIVPAIPELGVAISSLVTGRYRIHLSGNGPRGESVFRFAELYLPWVVRVL